MTQTTAPGFELAGRTALVTGGSRGLGRAMAYGLARSGAHVIVASRNGDACREFAEELTEVTGVEARGLGAHVGRWDALDELADEPPGTPSARSTSWSTTPACRRSTTR